MENLNGKVAVVTGGGSGIGRALSLAFAAEGMSVAVSDVDLAAAEAVATEVEATGAKAIAVQTDVRKRDAVKALAERAFTELGGVHVLCNNAGVVTFKNAAEMTPADWTWVMSVNLDGVVNGVTQFLPRLIQQGEEAHIVNTASIAGLYPAPNISSYVASKYAVVGLSEHLRIDLAPLNIGVSVLCPGGVRTQIVHAGRNRPDELGGPETPPEQVAQAGAGTYSGMDPADVAQLVLNAIKANRPYVVTHYENKAPLEQRLERLREAFAAQ